MRTWQPCLVMAPQVLVLVLSALILAAAADADAMSKAAAASPSDFGAGKVFFFEPFREGWQKKWVNSSDDKYNGEWEWAIDYSEVTGDSGLKMGSPGKLHAMASPIEGGLEVKDSTLVVQYEIKCSNGVSCDGQYLKLLQQDAGKDLGKFDNDARYTVMFGPDKCGATDKTHFIMQHQNPVSKQWEEKHATGMPTAQTDRNTHLYTLVIRPDNSFEVLVDLETKKKGSLLEDMAPPINPPKEIDDPEDSKPDSWVHPSTRDPRHETPNTRPQPLDPTPTPQTPNNKP